MSAFERNPFVLPMLAVVAGIAAEAALPGPPESYWPAVMILLFGGPGLLFARRESRRGLLRKLGACSLFFVGGFWLSLHPLPTPPSTNVQPGERVLVEGCVDSPVVRTPERIQFVLDTGDGTRMQYSLYPREGETAPPVSFGQTVIAEGRVRPPRNFRNPGSFDYERYLARKRIFWLLSATGVENLRVSDEPCGNGLLARIHGTRDTLLDRLQRRYKDYPEASAWLAAVLLGDDSALPDDTLHQYRLAGVYHILVISGQHIAILAGAFLLLARLLPIPRWVGFLAAALLCWTYTLVTGYEVPAVRAACGISLYLTGSLVFRKARPLNLLAIIALLFLAVDPGQLLDVSFQLSFLAVFAIAGLAVPLQRFWFGGWGAVASGLADRGKDLRLPAPIAQSRVELRHLALTLNLATRLPEWLCLRLLAAATALLAATGGLLVISLVVQAVLTPLLVQDFHRAPLVAPFTNLLLSPILSLAIPLAFLDLLLPIPGLAACLAWTVGFTNSLIAGFAAVSPDPRIPGAPALLLFACSVAAVAAIAAWEPFARGVSARERRENLLAGSTPGTPLRRWHSLALAASIAALLALILLHPFPPPRAAGEVEIVMLDVGQGDSTLVLSPEGPAMLIDTGGLGAYSSTSRLDTGEDIVAPYLWHRGIRRIDTLMLSHFDFDHAGGAPAILRIFQPRALWLPEMPEGHALWPAVAAAAREAGTRIEIRRAGESGDFGGIHWRAAHPGNLTRTAATPARHSNDNSLVIHFRYRDATILFTGDVERSGELEAVGRDPSLRADILKIAHHGSRTSSSEPFLEAVSPAVGLISAGWLNPYGHPHPAILERLRARGVALFRTDRDGAICFRSDGQRWRYESVP